MNLQTRYVTFFLPYLMPLTFVTFDNIFFRTSFWTPNFVSFPTFLLSILLHLLMPFDYLFTLYSFLGKSSPISHSVPLQNINNDYACISCAGVFYIHIYLYLFTYLLPVFIIYLYIPSYFTGFVCLSILWGT